MAGPAGSCFEPFPVAALVKAIARARNWYERIVSGEVSTVTQLAKKTRLSSVYVKRMMASATLSPHITEMILSGEHRPDLTLQELLQNVPLEWTEQPRALRLA